jgi:hypothetical protein
MKLADTFASWLHQPPMLDPASEDWLCHHCGNRAVIEYVCPSLDGERMLTVWSCENCKLVAATPDVLRLPPTNWVKRTEQ